MSCLVLSRRMNESIVIGPDVEVTVARIDRDKIRLAVKAPPTVAVHRKEILMRRIADNQAAASPVRTEHEGT